MIKAANFCKQYWGTFLMVAALLIFYDYASNNRIIDPFLFPPPERIKTAFSRNIETLFIGMRYSFRLLFPGLAIGTAIALLLGIPIVLLTPFCINLTSSFPMASVCLVVYGTTWPTLFATITGIQTIDKRYLDQAAVLEVKGVERMFRVLLPAAMPSILAGFINSLRIAFLALVYAEMFGAKYGMGYFVQYYYTLGRFENVIAGMIFLIIILILVMQVFERIKDRLLRWTID